MVNKPTQTKNKIKRLTLLLLSLLLTSAGSTTTEKYNRAKHFGSWIDADRDRQNTRHEVLIEESLIPVKYKTDKKRIVKTGLWWCPYTGEYYTNATALDIDHVIPLKEAWRSGADRWKKEKRRAFANSLKNSDHLIAVSKRANRQKSDRDPADWLPANKPWITNYLVIWTRIKKEWKLEIDPRERRVIIKYIPAID